MRASGSLHETLDAGAAASAEFKLLRRCVAKSNGRREFALAFVARALRTRPNALPSRVVSVIDQLLSEATP